MKDTKKVVLLPLDERPCNFKFPYQIFDSEDFIIDRIEPLGDKKIPADVSEVSRMLKEKCKDADIAVLAMDTLLYGGLIPSRLHHFTKEEVMERLNLLREIKSQNNNLKIYAFQCIMRCPKYSSNDEEPDYYEYCGEQIHQLGNAIHKEKLGISSDYNREELLSKIKKEDLEDYENRREFNRSFNLEVLKLAKEGVLEFLIIPQDDSAPYGYTAMDQISVRKEILENCLSDKVIVYPGADEVEMTLLSRAMNEVMVKRPKVYVKYASVHAPYLIPSYEDRSLGETVRYHIMAAGCIQVDSVSEADFVLALSAPARKMLEAVTQPASNADYDVERNLTEFVYAIETYISEGKPVTIGDNAYANGSDLELVAILNQKELLLKVAGYAGWNTSSNTIGTALAEGVKYLYYGSNKKHMEFLLLRYLEDAGYCGFIRKEITEKELPALGMNYFDIKEQNGVVSELVKKYLQDFADTKLTSITKHILIEDIKMPWRRMFETDITVSYR
ncbi:DUF4127 family protein [Lachnoclostridium phytofermentans]|uniref:DUF4127 domain-containing protein n=1 Tax=Lachnoclostridium phytofermentans (strain ATCC 700394 / DSM 18823 / ISDg) TaxID=357809 RepID=A9KIQ2_LACP7|nr:DUF4127 family protein [Lachnoclostridium phytofermentans]ABX43915.1 conserved hypothetical protein [Lachnoclostridium phytofermentans ISDg]